MLKFCDQYFWTMSYQCQKYMHQCTDVCNLVSYLYIRGEVFCVHFEQIGIIASLCGLGGVVEWAHLVSWPSVVRGNWTRLVMFCCILDCLLFLICIEFVYLYFPVLFCLSVSVKWLAVKIASKMTYTVSSGALNSTPSIHQPVWFNLRLQYVTQICCVHFYTINL